EKWEQIPAPALSRLIDATRFSASQDADRLAMHGAKLEPTETGLRMASSDGHRVTIATAECSGKLDVLIPLKPLLELGKLVGGIDGTVSMAVASGCLFVSHEGDEYSARLAGDVPFPPVDQAFPARPEHVIMVNREQLADAVKAVSISASQLSGAITLTADGQALLLKSEAPDTGEATDSVPC